MSAVRRLLSIGGTLALAAVTAGSLSAQHSYSPADIEDGGRLLRTGCTVEINQRMAVDAFAQDREVLANRSPIDVPLGRFVHKTICSKRFALAIDSRLPQDRHPAGK